MTEYSGFACSCGPRGKKRMELLHSWVKKTYYNNKEPNPKFYVTGMLYDLAGNYRAWIDDIPLDPGGWGAISASSNEDKELDPPEGFKTFIQFDRFEDGLALTLRAMYKRYGLGRKWVKLDEE